MKRIVLIDADIELYQITQKHQIEVDWGDGNITLSTDIEQAKIVFDETIKGIVKKVDADDYIVCLSGDNNFRKQNFPSYKSNRKATRKPLGYETLKQHAKDNHPHKIYDELEADDVMGILMTREPKDIDYVIHSDDKDMWTIPGNIWCRKRNKIIKNSRLEADRFLYTQILIGDTTDGYTGCPGIGKVKAMEVLKDCLTEDELRTAALKLYEKQSKKLTLPPHEAMLEQARQARILRSTDFNFKTKSVILWNPWEEPNGNQQAGKKVQEQAN